MLWANNNRIEELKLKISSLKKQVEEENKEWSEEKDIAKKNEEKRKLQYDGLLNEKQDLIKNIETLDKKIEIKLADINKAKRKAAFAKSQIEALQSVVRRQVANLEKEVEKSFDFQLAQRKERVKLILFDIDNGKVSPEEAINRLWDVYKSEHQLASEAELFTGMKMNERNQKEPVKYLRLGKQIMMFKSDNDLNVGILVKQDSGYQWLGNRDLTFEQRSAVKTAVETAEGKKDPKFVNVPIWLSADFKGEN